MAASNNTTSYGSSGPLKARVADEKASVNGEQDLMPERQVRDSEALFEKERTGNLIRRGEVTEVLRVVGLQEKLGSSFDATARLAFDAHSADQHFLTLPEFKQLYFRLAKHHPELLPRKSALAINIVGTKGLHHLDLNLRTPDAFCTVQVSGKPLTKSQTGVESSTEPSWSDELDDCYGYEHGDSLLFEVFDCDRGVRPKLLGRASLPSEEFHRVGGFDGLLPLLDGRDKKTNAELKVRVVVSALPAAQPNLKISIVGANDLPPADANGLADPYCCAQLAGKPYSKVQTKRIVRTLDPSWNEDFDDKYRYTEGDSIVFEVFDYDKSGKNELLGRGTLSGEKFHRVGGFDGQLDLVDGPRGYSPKLHVRVLVLALENDGAVGGAPSSACFALPTEPTSAE